MTRPQEPIPTQASEITFTNIWQNATVGNRVTIVHGQVNGGGTGSILNYYYNNSFPSQRFPMVDGTFKALVVLESGTNKIMFETEDGGSPKRAELVLKYQPVIENPPVHYVLLLGKDSPGVFDSPGYKKSFEGNDLEVAKKKLRLASYMMSAYTQEQMSRNQFGFRTFRPYEEFEPDTLSNRDTVPQRSTTHIHVVRTRQTVAEIRDPDVAQQNKDGKRTGDLFGWAADALNDYGGPFTTGEVIQAACIYVDGHWDQGRKLIVGHAALGGCAGGIRLAIFGGHALYSWPTSIEDLPSAFLDETEIGDNEVANDSGQSASAWEALNVAQGAFTHEVGHLLGCPHEPDGIMLRGYLNWNRSFMATEGYSVREKKRVMKTIQPKDEGFWHRLDIMRFRYHPSFRLPGEARFLKTSKPLVFPTQDGINIRAPQGIYMIDIHAEDWSRNHMEFPNLPTDLTLSLNDIENQVEQKFRGGKIEIHVHAPAQEQTDIADVRAFIQSSNQGQFVQSSVIGRQVGTQQTVKLPNDTLQSVRIWSGDALDGIEFIYPKGSVIFGKQGGQPHDLPVDSGNEFLGLAIRGGYWIDAGGIVTSKFQSETFGGPGGSLAELVPPRGHRIAGVTGWFEAWCVGIAILYER